MSSSKMLRYFAFTATSRPVSPSDNVTDSGNLELERGEIRSGLKPYVFQEGGKEQPRPSIFAAPSTSDQFIPDEPYDTLFTAMRHMIFKVNRKSATLIAHTLSQTCTSVEIVELIRNLCPESTSPKNLNYDKWWEKSDDEKFEHPPYAKFHAKIEEARKFYAISLHGAGFEDVDITYSGAQANYGIVKEDEEAIRNTVSFVFGSFLNMRL